MGWGIDWMVAVGEVDGGLVGGVGRHPGRAGQSRSCLVVAGFLWLALWGERWRLAGLVPMLAGDPDRTSAPRGRMS